MEQLRQLDFLAKIYDLVKQRFQAGGTNGATTQIVDTGGNTVGVTANALDVNVVSGSTGLVTSVGSATVIVPSISTTGNIQLPNNPCKYCVISSPPTNTGAITIGDMGVHDYIGIVIYPTNSVQLDITNTNLLYAIATVDSEILTITYFN